MARIPAKSPSRRQLLLGSLGGLGLAAAATTPAWLRTAFADTTSCPPPTTPPKGRVPTGSAAAATAARYSQVPHSSATFRAAFTAAQTRGKPLLVLVVPADDMKSWERGSIFGAYLNHATPDQLAPLALVDVVCATRNEVAAQITAGVPAGDPLMLLLDTDGSKIVTPLDHPIAAAPQGNYNEDYGKRVKAADAAVDAQISDVSALLRTATLGNDAAMARWRAQAAKVVPASQVQALTADFAAQKDIDAARLDRGAIFVARPVSSAATSSGAAEFARAGNLLGAAAGTRLTTREVSGSFWASAAGCGTNVEGDPTPSMIGCGMGMVPTKATRFLYFFAPHGARP